MRFSGHLQTWNDERGFGFIRPADGGQDIFVHVSSLPRPVPGPDQVLTFEVALNRDGKKKAVDVRLQRVEQQGLAADRARSDPARTAHRHRARPRCRSWLGPAVTFVLLSAGAVFGWSHYQDRASFNKAVAEYGRSHSCDGRTMCSQMTSCVEATYFLRHCPGTQMDGDRDGVPCEQQLCE